MRFRKKTWMSLLTPYSGKTDKEKVKVNDVEVDEDKEIGADGRSREVKFSSTGKDLGAKPSSGKPILTRASPGVSSVNVKNQEKKKAENTEK